MIQNKKNNNVVTLSQRFHIIQDVVYLNTCVYQLNNGIFSQILIKYKKNNSEMDYGAI